jgi:hypothetical protein
MVFRPYTVVDPRAVMVIPIYADITNVAVFRPWSSDDLTLRTKRGGIIDHHELQEVKIPVFLHLTWVHTPRTDAEEHTGTEEKPG